MDVVEYYQNYLAHFGTKGQEWGKRHFQSYETAPTRSGMVGQEVGEAAKQSDRLTRKEKSLEKYREKLSKEAGRYSNANYQYALRKFTKASAKESKLLDKYTKKTQGMIDKLHTIDKDDPRKDSKANALAKKMTRMERKAELAKAKTEEARKKVNMAYLDNILQETAIRRMSYKDLKSDRGKRRLDIACALLATPPAFAGAYVELGKKARMDKRLAKYKKEHSYTDPKTGTTTYSLTEDGDRTLYGPEDGYADIVLKDKRRP